MKIDDHLTDRILLLIKEDFVTNAMKRVRLMRNVAAVNPDPKWVRGAFYYPGSPDDPGWREPLLYNRFPDDRAGELRYETWEYLCEVDGYMVFTRKMAIDMGLRKELLLWEVGITTLAQLLENLVIINDALRAKGLETFSKFELELDLICRYGNQHCWRCNHPEPYIGEYEIIQERSTWLYDRVDIWAVSESLIKQEIMSQSVIIKQEEIEDEDQNLKSNPDVEAGRDRAFQEYAIPAIEDLNDTIDNNNKSQRYLSWEAFLTIDNDQEMPDMMDTAFAIPDSNMGDHGPANTKRSCH
jgi:hypothetical protein